MNKLLSSTLLFAASVFIGHAQTDNAPTHTLAIWRAHTLKVLGSEDVREAFEIYYGYEQRAPSLSFPGRSGSIVVEAYAGQSWSGGVPPWKQDTTYNYGALALDRYRWGIGKNGLGLYFDFGVGLQYDDRISNDIDRNLNSTPAADLGLSWNLKDGRQLMIGARYLHISNANTAGHNKGQNQLGLLVGYRF